jgi:phytoene dehydrogenase-like protein
MRRPEAEQARYIAGVQEAMRATLRARAPEWAASIRGELTASPRTFERFTGRPLGAVGGIPRRAGLGNYRTLGPTEVEDGLYLVGDSVFPGQSALATAIGGVRTAAAIGRRLGALRPAGRSRSA